MKNSSVKKSRVSALLVILSVCVVMTSCKFGKAISDLDDACPIVLVDGITVMGAESCDGGKAVEIRVSINTGIYDVPPSGSSEWRDVVSTVTTLMYNNPECANLLNTVKGEKKGYIIRISNHYGNVLHTSTSLIWP